MTKTMLNKEMLESIIMDCSTFHIDNSYCIERTNANGVKFFYSITLYDSGFITIYKHNNTTDSVRVAYGMTSEVA